MTAKEFVHDFFNKEDPDADHITGGYQMKLISDCVEAYHNKKMEELRALKKLIRDSEELGLYKEEKR